MRSSETPARVRSARRGDDVAIISPVGEFDIAVVDVLRSAFEEVVTPDCHKVVVDLSETAFLDAMALGAIVGAARRARGWGGWLRLVSPRPTVEKMLHVTGLDRTFGLYETVTDAVAEVSES